MDDKRLRELAGLVEAVEDKEIASEVTKLLGLFRIASQRVAKRGGSAANPRAEIEEEYQLGWADAERAFNKIAAKEFKGVKPFRK